MDRFYEQEMPELTHTTVEQDIEEEDENVKIGARKRRRDLKVDPKEKVKKAVNDLWDNIMAQTAAEAEEESSSDDDDEVIARHTDDSPEETI